MAYFSGSEAAALAYDRWFDEPWGKYAFRVEAGLILRQAGPLACRRVADVGCGTGRFMKALEDRGGAMTGLDLDPAMLRIAALRVDGHIVEGDAHAMPFADAVFDLVIAVTLCEFAGDAPGVFAELARVTRAGGRFIVGALNPRSPWGFADRRRFLRPPWRDVEFLSRGDLLALGRPYGRVSIHGALFATSGTPWLSRLGPVAETAGRLLPQLGGFQVLVVQRS